MNGFSFPTELDRLRFLMRKAVNGILAEHLRESFPQYRRIYGLELPRIREICASFHPSRPLAIDLWNSNVREEMFAATLLFPRDDVSPDDVRFLLSTALTGELQQQLARNLLSFVLSEQQVCSSSSRRTTGSVPYSPLLRWLPSSLPIRALDASLPYRLISRTSRSSRRVPSPHCSVPSCAPTHTSTTPSATPSLRSLRTRTTHAGSFSRR